MENTIVTACDSAYFWGAYILVASLRRHGVEDPIHVLADDFTNEDKALLEQFGNLRIIMAGEKSHSCMATQKPDAIFTADTELITWLDADLMAVGNIESYFRSEPSRFQIRLRGSKENQLVYAREYRPTDTHGGIPEHILECWRRDVGEREKSALMSTVNTCSFVLNRNHLPFIAKWKNQMSKVLSPDVGVVDSRNPASAYFMTDESVLNSLFAFAENAPEIAEYMFDKDPQAFLAHFSLQPKPWHRWSHHVLKHYDPLMEVLRWVRKEGYAMPPMPFSLKEHNRIPCYADACFRHYCRLTLRAIRNAGRTH